MFQSSEVARKFFETVRHGPKELGATIAILISAFWYAFTSVLAWVLGGLFVVDLVLGVFRSVHKGGLQAFDWNRFTRAWIKMGAALVGLALFALGDVLFQQFGIPNEWFPLTTAGLVGMCFGFFWSALGNFGYFFPKVRERIESLIDKISAKEPTEMRRRSSDSPNKEETSG